jgi:hypothetical protein
MSWASAQPSSASWPQRSRGRPSSSPCIIWGTQQRAMGRGSSPACNWRSSSHASCGTRGWVTGPWEGLGGVLVWLACVREDPLMSVCLCVFSAVLPTPGPVRVPCGHGVPDLVSQPSQHCPACGREEPQPIQTGSPNATHTH